MNARNVGAVLFRVVYNSSYTILFFFLIVALAVSPADHIYQTRKNHKLGNVFVVGGVYLLTALLALFIYSSRLYTNRTTLAAIPKPYLPIEEGEVSKKVYKMIAKNRQRSALIAWESRPKVLRSEIEASVKQNDNHHSSTKQRSSKKAKSASKEEIIPISPSSPPWGKVVHPGWSSPATVDLPDLQFDTVVAELPNLIEAKAVSIAPPDTSLDFVSSAQNSLQSPPDPNLVAQLQRRSEMGLRDYLAHLNRLGVFSPPSLAGDFLTKYEHARFSTYALTEDEFRDLMVAFSNLLIGMQGLNPEFQNLSNSPSSTSITSRRMGSQSSIIRKPKAHFDHLSSQASSISSSESVIRHNLTEESPKPASNRLQIS